MKIGLYDVDSTNFPNLALMKISAFHKKLGHEVEMINFLNKYDKVYVSKIFSDEYSTMDLTSINADEIIYGGTGFAINIVDGKEVYQRSKDSTLPTEIESIYPDYSLYPQYTNDVAYGFLTRGCCNNCSFCIVSKKEGLCSRKVADLSKFWSGQKKIVLLDPNILACKDRIELLNQLIESNAKVEFSQGLDARFITKDIVEMLNKIKVCDYHFAFDFMKFEDKIREGLQCFVDNTKLSESALERTAVYMIVNYDTTIWEYLRRIDIIRYYGLRPYVMIYRKNSASKMYKDMQRWSNNAFVYRSCHLSDYVPRKDGKTFSELYLR